jgi:hypothetical protein
MAVAQEAPGMLRKDPAFYTWSFPGAPVRIHLYLDAVEGLQRQLAELSASASGGHVEFTGLLLGRGNLRHSPIVEVRGFVPVISETRSETAQALTDADQTQFGKALAAAESSSDGRLSPVGYFRVRGNESVSLHEDDLAVIHSHFRDPASVFLVIRPGGDGPAAAGFFFSDTGQINADFTFLEFPFDSKTLSGHAAKLARRPQLVEPGQRAETPAANVPQAKPPVRPPAPPAPIARIAPTATRSARSAFTAGLWFVAAAAVVAALMVALVGLGYWNFRLSSAPPIAAAETPAGLALQVERQGSELKVTWEHTSDFIANARSGVLQVRDGDSRLQELFLDSGQLRNGSVVYTPAGSSVQFRLEVLGAEKTMSESVLALTAPRTADTHK